MSINLLEKFSPKLDERYKLGSRTDAACGNDFDWEGVNSIKVLTLMNPTLNDYQVGSGMNRFGTPTEVQDEAAVYSLNKKRSFSNTFDVVNVQDQGFVKKAVMYLKQVWDEVYVPEIDKYRLQRWANGAATVEVNATALTKGTVVEAMLSAQAALDDLGVPHENRFIFAKSSIIIKYKLADEFKTADGIMTKYAIKGQKGEVDGSPLIGVPDSYMPAGVNFMIKYKKASADPMKLKILRAHENAPGIAGTLMEGLCRYDSFVLANKANGIYVHAQSGACTTPTIEIASNQATMTAGGGETIKYTVDGTNPKTSETAEVYNSSSKPTIPSGATVRAYAYKTGTVNSGIGEAVNA